MESLKLPHLCPPGRGRRASPAHRCVAQSAPQFRQGRRICGILRGCPPSDSNRPDLILGLESQTLGLGLQTLTLSFNPDPKPIGPAGRTRESGPGGRGFGEGLQACAVPMIVEVPSMLLPHHIIAHKLSPGSAMGVNPLRLAFRRFLPTFPSQRLGFVTVTVGIGEGP